MEPTSFHAWIGIRTKDMRAGWVMFAAASLGLTLILAIAGDAVSGAMQTAFIVVTVVLMLMSLLWLDGCLQDFDAFRKDIPASEENSHIAENMRKGPIGAFRAIIAVAHIAVTAALIVAAIAA